MAPNQLPTTGPTGKQWARSPANKVTNYLTLSIALVTLIAVAYATSNQAQANSLASLSPTENSKRDSRGDGPAAKSIDDSTKTEQQQQQSQQPEEQQQEQQQQPDQGSAAKYTTLLEDEQESSPVPTAASAKPGEPAEVKARELTSAPAYGTLVYDQTAQRPAVRDGSTSTSSSPWVVGSMLKRLYCNVVYYLPFLNQLTNWFLPSCQGNKVDTSAEGTTTRGSQVHVAESKRQQQGISIGIGSNSNEGNGRQQQQSIDNGLHAKANVSVSLLVNHSEEAKENHKEISDHDAKDGMLENNGETNKQQQRVSGDESAANDDDGANQDNQQSQTNDKEGKLLLKQQPQLLKHGLKNVKVTVDRKKTNDDDTEEEEAEKANNNNIKDNHYDDAIDDDHFSGQFVNNGNNGAEPSAAAAQDDSVQHQRQRASKSWDLKRDRAPQSFVIENDNDMDMSQMVPAEEVGHRPRYTTTDNDDADDDENDEAVEHDQLQVASSNNNNGYNMMKHSNLLVPIGSASDVPIRTSSNSIRQQQQPDSLLGKYIYAPTQHYYLNSMIPSAALVGSGGGPNSDVGGPFSHQHRVLSSNGGKHIQPGDTIYGSYGGNMPMKAAYAYQSEHTSIGNKPSDLYFLVMVGAFCVMAMAVVLAAGLFAYRIQQNRKSSQDTDYPTYGVVGPNNMSAKCGGAASFVGGYFTGPPSGSSKSGSAKHLPDLYGTPNGAGGSDSGLNSLDKSSSNKKAASVSSLNEQHTHQSANSRTASSNFMAAASQDAARMYHYQHQKQQMIISDRNSGGRQTSASDLDSEDENDDGSYTVYECPGLASAHEMEIKNPLFNDDQSP
uniref:Neural proliferation differentiation and control protein 1 n=1 Tax=Aceria tosichella TaxID=561515 RepID=A0A6G1SMS0_9ACAR